MIYKWLLAVVTLAALGAGEALAGGVRVRAGGVRVRVGGFGGTAVRVRAGGFGYGGGFYGFSRGYGFGGFRSGYGYSPLGFGYAPAYGYGASYALPVTSYGYSAYSAPAYGYSYGGYTNPAYDYSGYDYGTYGAYGAAGYGGYSLPVLSPAIITYVGGLDYGAGVGFLESYYPGYGSLLYGRYFRGRRGFSWPPVSPY